MKKASLFQDLQYKDDKPAINVLLDTTFTKEIRIAMKEGHVMKEHQTPFPIVVEIVEGSLGFGVDGVIHDLVKGDLVALEGGVPHDLKATIDCIIRLTLTKADQVKRVKGVIEKS